MIGTTGGQTPLPQDVPVLTVEALRVVRGKRTALRDVSLSISKGRITGLLGPSGSGKTTLLRSIVGSQVIAEGTVEVFGLPAGSAGLRRRVAYVTQALGVYSDLTVRENVAFYAKVLSTPDRRINEVIEAVSLEDYVEQLAAKLSDGQRARVSLATALLSEPELLVLDEPTAGLDPILRRDIWELFAKLAAAGATLLVSSHVMDEATRCDQLVLLDDGVVVASGTPEELCGQTGTPDVEAAFLSLLERTR